VNSIEAMAADMERQLSALPRLKLPRPRGKVALVGSGDSYVAALAACYLSSGAASCHHPPDIIANPLAAQGRDVHLVSVSGLTKANVLAARVASKTGLHTVAVTADGKSPLAQTCDDVIELEFHGAGKTSGTLGFTASLLACTSLATKGEVACPANLDKLYSQAKSRSAKLSKIRTDSIVILGNSLLYPAAMYGALKFNEVFGTKAFAYPLEDFFHAPLFGLKKRDQILVLESSRLANQLRKKGFDAFHVECSRPAAIESLLYAVFFMQHLVLGIAERRDQIDCYFIKNKKMLELSSDVIY
jgi:fructoselysine-6-P-deglycase FrlB-like protein